MKLLLIDDDADLRQRVSVAGATTTSSMLTSRTSKGSFLARAAATISKPFTVAATGSTFTKTHDKS
ncbi:MAG TPA: hypothetical protein VL978_16360 [Puia sp.]|nr:hypothetical protein [Puia sp.]